MKQCLCSSQRLFTAPGSVLTPRSPIRRSLSFDDSETPTTLLLNKEIMVSAISELCGSLLSSWVTGHHLRPGWCISLLPQPVLACTGLELTRQQSAAFRSSESTEKGFENTDFIQ